jgi:hypothetical protein
MESESLLLQYRRRKMKHQSPNVLLSVTLLAAMSSMAWGQQCSDWSPEFDQIDDPVALQQLQSARSEGWPNLNPQMNGGISLQQGIQSLDQAIQQFQQQLQQAQQAWLATRSSNAPMPKMNATECRNSNNMGAAMAAACEVDNMHNAILAAQGRIDLARCRAGMPATSHSSFDSMGSGTSYPGGGSGSYAPSFESGAASVAGLNVSKRSGMVNSVTKGWHPPAAQQQAQDSLAQSAPLADPFADSESNSSATSSSGSVASSDAPNSKEPAMTAAIGSDAGSSSGSGTPATVTGGEEPTSNEPAMTAAAGSGSGSPPGSGTLSTVVSNDEPSSNGPGVSANSVGPGQGSNSQNADKGLDDHKDASLVAAAPTGQPPSGVDSSLEPVAALPDPGDINVAANGDPSGHDNQSGAGISSQESVTTPSVTQAGESGPTDRQLSIADTVLSLADTSMQSITSGIDELKNSGVGTSLYNFVTTEVEPSLSGTVTDIGGVAISIGKGLLDPGVALGVKAIVDQANDPNKLLNTNERNQMCAIFPEECQAAPAQK